MWPVNVHLGNIHGKVGKEVYDVYPGFFGNEKVILNFYTKNFLP